MDHILVINSSTSGEGSVSRALVEDAVQLLLASEPDAVVTRRDLGDDPIPHLTPGTVAGVRAVVATEDELVTSSLSDDLIAEIREATVLVIGAPMYNFNIPSPLRTWFDHVLRPRVTFLLHEPDRSLQGHRRSRVRYPNWSTACRRTLRSARSARGWATTIWDASNGALAQPMVPPR